MNKGLKNKLLMMATAAGLAGFGLGCSSSSEEAPAAEEGASEATSGDEAAPAAEEAAPEEGAPAEGAAPAEGGEGSCGEGSCS